MKKEKGFTLAELLAVIVILAIILIIAVPGVLGIINKAKKDAWVNSAAVLLNAMKTDHQVNGVKEKTEYSVKNNKIIRKATPQVPSGEVPFEGKYEKTGEVTIDEKGKTVAAFSNDQWCAWKTVKDTKLQVKDGDCDLSIFDTTPPVIKQFVSTGSTSNSITVSLACEDPETRIIGYQYSKDGGKTYTDRVDESIYTFDKLKSGNYQLKGKCINKAELVTESEVIEKSTVEVEAPTYSIDPSGDVWALKKTVTITYPERKSGYSYQYSLDGGSNWITVDTGTTKEIEFTSNGSVIARIYDGTNYKNGSSYSIGKIDSTAPAGVSVTIGTKTSSSIQVTANGSDSETGISKYEFSINGKAYIDNGKSNIYTFTNVASGNHTIKVRLTNAVGLTTEASTSAFTTDIPVPTYSVSPSGDVWAPSKTVTITYPERQSGFVYQYSTNGGSSWETVSSGTTQTVNFTSNGTVIARVYDGTNYKTASAYTVAKVGTDPACFTFDASTGSITDYSDACPKIVTIPSTISGVPVTSIGNRAFYRNELTSVTIPDSVTTIGVSAFLNNKLTSVIIPNSVTSIGNSAFEWNDLTSVTIPNSIKTIEPGVFMDNQLTSVTIPDSVTSIGNSAFGSNYELTSVTIPDSVTSIGGSAFNGTGLTSVTLGNSVKTIGNRAFFLSKLTSVTIPDSVTTIGEGAFWENQLTSVTIPDSVTEIGVLAFVGNRITSVTIGKGLTEISRGLFSENMITSVTIPDNVTSIGGSAFSDNQLTSLTIPSSVTTIGGGAFNHNQLPDEQAFIYKRNADGTEDKTTIVSYGGAKRDNLIIPSNITTIGYAAFNYNQLPSVTIPDSVTTIEGHAFRSNQLTSVTIPNGVTTIGAEAFNNNPLSSIIIKGKTALSEFTSLGSSWYSGSPTITFEP